MMPYPRFPPATVVKVERKGYRCGDKLFRPVLVMVPPAQAQ
ncbi:MAG: hypothetical protein LJE64_00545 [Desulfofustis sp.]|nr:hypothetical protein [Desulfofustis sp.]